MGERLHLCCGGEKLEGYVNVDVDVMVEPDVVCDLSVFPYPWGDGSVEEVFIKHGLEHLPDTSAVMGELHRVLELGGFLRIIVPYFANPSEAVPEHLCRFNYLAFTWYEPLFDVVDVKLQFLTSKGFMPSNNLIECLVNWRPLLYQRFFCYMLPFSELHVSLRKKDFVARPRAEWCRGDIFKSRRELWEGVENG